MSFHKASNKSSMFDDGFMKLNDELEELIKWADNDRIESAQETGAEYLVEKVHQLSKPRRTGKTLESVTYEKNPSEKSTDVGWSSYHGPIVVKGHYAGPRTSRSKKKNNKETRNYVPAQPHVYPTYKNEKEKITQKMIKKLRGE